MKRSISFIIIVCIFIVWNFSLTGAEVQVDSAAVLAPQSAAIESGKVSLNLKGMDVIEVIKMLATKGGLNVVVASDVKGRVTIFLKSVNIMDAFEIILVSNDLAYDKRGEILYVMPQKEYEAMYGERYADKKEVRIFQLKFAKALEVSKALNQMKTKVGKIIVDEGSDSIVVIDSPDTVAQITETITKIDLPTVTKVFEFKYAKVADIKPKISETLTRGVGTMQIDERTNKIMVTDLERKMREIDEMVTAFDDKLQQVLIEAKIVQVTLDDKYQLGVDWDSLLKKFSKEISLKSAFQITAINTLTPGAQLVVGTLGVSEYAVMIQALKEVGDTNLLSSPRITALNNQEAKILIGTSQPYATNTVTQGTSTTTTGTNLNFIDIGVKLFVTPTINKDGFVTMKIRPEVSSSSGTYSYGGSTTQTATTVPIVSTTQAETSVSVKDGTTIIIAGLIKDERSSTVDKIPFLGDIPIAGEAFKKTNNEIKKQELVIFLTPHIITGANDYLELPQSSPMGEKKFTMPEKPTFNRREPVEMKPGVFKEKKRWLSEEVKEVEAEMKQKELIGKRVPAASAEEYCYAIKERIVENITSPKTKRGSPTKGVVKVAFLLSPDGSVTYGPEILNSSNHDLDAAAVNAVKRAAPFPAFPQMMGKNEKRFTMDISFE